MKRLPGAQKTELQAELYMRRVMENADRDH